MSWRIAIRHRTGYKYAEPVRASYNEARLTPPSVDGQRLLQAALVVTPAVRPFHYVDYWGTAVDSFDVHVPHTELVVLATSTVETAQSRPVPSGVSWSELAAPAVQDRFAEYLTASSYVTRRAGAHRARQVPARRVHARAGRVAHCRVDP